MPRVLMERYLSLFLKTHKMNIFLIKIPVGFFVETEELTVELTVIFMKKSRELGLAEVFLKAVRRASPGQGTALLSKVT